MNSLVSNSISQSISQVVSSFLPLPSFHLTVIRLLSIYFFATVSVIVLGFIYLHRRLSSQLSNQLSRQLRKINSGTISNHNYDLINDTSH